jgi:hypothetical protein
MKTMWQEATRNELADRVSRLTPAGAPRWGRLSAPRMMAHIVDSLKMAVGELDVPSKNLPLRYPPFKQLVIYWLPFPKNAPTAPELIARTAIDWELEVRLLMQLVDRFVARTPDGPWPRHPAFGAMTGRAWGVLVYRHTDHHLRQFGV